MGGHSGHIIGRRQGIIDNNQRLVFPAHGADIDPGVAIQTEIGHAVSFMSVR
jgi:hypothetical protein